jgi:hypothetical protein
VYLFANTSKVLTEVMRFATMPERVGLSCYSTPLSRNELRRGILKTGLIKISVGRVRPKHQVWKEDEKKA